MDYGTGEALRKLSDPLWFQSFGAVLGMDWHSSGITTSVMGALKKALNPISRQLGLYVCGGRGKHARQTPVELMKIADETGFDGNQLVKSSKLTAKIDNTAIQDGFQLYLHSFIVDKNGDWSVIQQGMNGQNRMARRYHWHSKNIKSFVEEPHTGVCGINQGLILNLVHEQALETKTSILKMSQEGPGRLIPECKKILLPAHHEVKHTDVNLKRLGAIIALAYETGPADFESLLLLKGLGPKTLRSLTLVSEVIHGTPSRFEDPARFSIAHGGKDGHPFPVQTKTYDESVEVLKNAIQHAKLGQLDKQKAIKKLQDIARGLEKRFVPNNNFYKYLEKERQESADYGGRTVFDDKKKSNKPAKGKGPRQLSLFD
jgi:hypothetical protein